MLVSFPGTCGRGSAGFFIFCVGVTLSAGSVLIAFCFTCAVVVFLVSFFASGRGVATVLS